MNRYISKALMFWKTIIFCLKFVFKVIFLIVIIPIKLVHHSVKSGVDYTFKDTNLNSKQLETIEKGFEYSAYVAWGQNLFPETFIIKSWYTQLIESYPQIAPYLGIITFIYGIFAWMIAFNLKKER
jgi:hypothetical protein